ncbi:indolepyruvate ferredoxin oxidoreductase family protein [Microvirga pudoricolor]|uniref:indolepyruvate ferredoxin oxidoreductase family protein n=1 Tax=Microvirga pudoricolor TaxID=2778729 RepID=UPI0019515065|nr:indolepyruvate ferredoxin oxidoreductase family protein [Microvirga pudoricolor]MBM6594857.1 indolepyruvate ferredoxin oxidoreductase family protein [Microvirga pudoricolor]
MHLRQVSLDDKYKLADGQVFLTGVQALVRLPMMQRAMDAAAGLNTAGFVTGYPGSPLASYDVQLRQAQALLADHHVRFQPGLNEDLAMTSVWGSQQGEVRGDSKVDGVFALWYGKGAGLDRSGDALRHGNLAGSSKHGGVLLLLGDDHRAESSSVTHNAEYTMVDFMMPLLNPADIGELMEYGLFGIALSRYSGSWTGLKCLHDVVESAGSIDVTTEPRRWTIPGDFDMPPGGLGLRYPDTPLAQEARLHHYKLDAVKAFARANGIDRSLWKQPSSRFGIVTTGKTYLDVLEALDDLGLTEERAAAMGLAIYKVGMPYPLEPQGARAFCDGLETVFVVEEKRSLIETQLKELLFRVPHAPSVIGKTDQEGRSILPTSGVLASNQIGIWIARFLLALKDDPALRTALKALEGREAGKVIPLMPLERRPSFCSGCPHNRSTVVPEGSRGGAGTGCNYMVMWMDRGSVGYTQMGADGVNWIGEAPFSNRDHVFQNLGDGTYTHSGLLAIRATVAADVNITYKILYNGVVAMTGGQPHDFALSPAVIARQVLAEGARKVVLVTDEPSRHGSEPMPDGVDIRHRDDLDEVQRALRDVKGVTVLIYDQMCATEKRRLRKRGQLADPPKRAFINHLVCEGCGDCSVKSNCVSVLPRETALGRKREIDQYSCNKDFSCTDGFCPSFVTVHGGELRKKEVAKRDDGPDLPRPTPRDLDQPYNIVLAGVGGTGVITLAAILGMAAHLEGKGCATLDMMGLAQKGGAVTSHVRVAASPSDVRAARIPVGTADVVLGCDILALASHEPISTIGYDRTIVLANTNEAMPGDFARNRDLAFPAPALRGRIEAASGAANVTYVDATRRAMESVGDTIGTNTYLLGMAYQRGLIPISEEAIERAFELNGVGVALNKAAFRAGRRAALSEPVAEAPAVQPPDLPALLAHREAFLTDYQDKAYARSYREFVESVRRVEQQRLPGSTALTMAVAESLAKLMTYKDEYEVARLYTSGEFEREIKAKFTGDYKLEFLLAPPVFARRDKRTGELKKRGYGPWIFPAFKMLARFRRVRGTFVDPFGHTAERKMERALIADYRETIGQVLKELTSENHHAAVAIASLPQDIRGYGHVKDKAVHQVRERQVRLLDEFRQTAYARAAE